MRLAADGVSVSVNVRKEANGVLVVCVWLSLCRDGGSSDNGSNSGNTFCPHDYPIYWIIRT